MAERRHDFYLLTPGPLTVAPEVKREMLVDRSPNSRLIANLTETVQSYLLEICNGTATHECVSIQGSATYVIEAGLQTLVPRNGKVLVVENGFYGRRLRELSEGIGLPTTTLELPMLPLPTADDVEAMLDADTDITHIIMCHAETGIGALNPAEDIGALARKRGKEFMIDAVATFGGFFLDVTDLDPLAVFISPNKCLEGVPGVGMAIVRRDSLQAAEGISTSVSLDLYAQWRFFRETGYWRFTPPTHVIGALAKACERHRAEGGIAARQERYCKNWRLIVDGLRQRGFRMLLPDEVAAPIVATVHNPVHPNYSFEKFAQALERRGVVIFPGTLTAAETFRIGVMGDLVESDMEFILSAIDEALEEIGATLLGS